MQQKNVYKKVLSIMIYLAMENNELIKYTDNIYVIDYRAIIMELIQQKDGRYTKK